MHIHHYTLRQLGHYIRKNLIGGEVVECFTQEKDELVIGMAAPDFQLYLKVKCTGPLPYIWPQDDYQKARKNTLPLFQEVVGFPLTEVRVLANERVLVLVFGKRNLVLKMHGLQSNVIFRHRGKVKSVFRKNILADLEYKEEPGIWNEELIGEIKEDSLAQGLRMVSPMLDKNFVACLENELKGGNSIPETLVKVIDEAKNGEFFLGKKGKRIQFQLFGSLGTDAHALKGNVVLALNDFFRAWHLQFFYEKQYRESERALGTPVKKLEGQIGRYLESIEKIGKSRSAEEIGSILMANIHVLKSGLKEVELFDFYNNEQIKIKLDPKRNPQQNAERFFKKQKKRKGQVKHLKIQIKELEKALLPKLEVLEEFEGLLSPDAYDPSDGGLNTAPMKLLRNFRKTHASLLEAGKKGPKVYKSPFLEFEKDGYLIWVGRNAKNNDELTLHQARKEDIWMHAKDVRGSHVVVRNPQGKPLPKPVLEYAAALAAWFSKRKSDGMVPVQYTSRKYVRKRKGDPAGAVMVDREKVILIEPAKG